MVSPGLVRWRGMGGRLGVLTGTTPSPLSVRPRIRENSEAASFYLMPPWAPGLVSSAPSSFHCLSSPHGPPATGTHLHDETL